MTADRIRLLTVVNDLLAVGAHQGAAQILFNAEIAARRDASPLKLWTPWGPLAARPRPLKALG